MVNVRDEVTYVRDHAHLGCETIWTGDGDTWVPMKNPTEKFPEIRMKILVMAFPISTPSRIPWFSHFPMKSIIWYDIHFMRFSQDFSLKSILERPGSAPPTVLPRPFGPWPAASWSRSCLALGLARCWSRTHGRRGRWDCGGCKHQNRGFHMISHDFTWL